MEINDLFALQIFTVVCLFAVSVLGTAVPLRLRAYLKGDAFDTALSLANSTTVGIFLATGMGHMLVHCATGLAAAGRPLETSLQYATMLCLAGFVLTLVIEKVVLHGAPHDHAIGSDSGGGDSTVPVFLAIVLAVHGVLEGIAMGVEKTSSSLRVVLVGMVPHKFFTGIALGISLQKYSATTTSAVRVAVSWATATPGGVLLGMILVSGFSGGSMDAALQGLASGTFLYISICEILHEEFSATATRGFNAAKVSCVVGGMLLAFWLEGHAHAKEGGTPHEHHHD